MNHFLLALLSILSRSKCLTDIGPKGTQIGLEWFKRAMVGSPSSGPNLGIVMGPEFQAMTGNLARNLGENRLGVPSAVLIRN